MKEILAVIVAFVIGVVSASGQYTVDEVAGSVTVSNGGRDVAVTKGMALTPMDDLTLGKGASVKIFSKAESRSYSWSKEGRHSVQSIKIGAGKAAESVIGRVGGSLSFTRSQGAGEGYVYVESGMVKRSMATYDPAAQNVEVDAKLMSAFVVDALRCGKCGNEAMPAEVTHGRNASGGLAFSVVNTLENPIYFNVLKIKGGAVERVEISELGQPSGSYVLLPSQSIAREQLAALGEGDRHVLVMAHFNFDVDKLIEHMEEAMRGDGAGGTKAGELNVYVRTL